MASTRREKDLARLRAERQAARRAAEAARRKRRNATIASALAVLVVVAAVAFLVTRGSGKKTTAAAPPTTSTCTYTKSGTASRQVDLPPATPVATGPVSATVTTNQGVIGLTLDAAAAPCTSNAIISLAAQKFFDGTPCHRLTSGGLNVLQCGDPSGTGSGGPGYQYADEDLKDARIAGGTYPAGTLAMANSGANTNGSQFFLVYKDSQLPASYTPVGTITTGLDVVNKIAAAGEDPAGDGKPTLPVTITTFTTTAGTSASATPSP